VSRRRRCLSGVTPAMPANPLKSAGLSGLAGRPVAL
jgi:hypothetical protein